MITIGITGGIGSGKSEVCRYLEKTYDACILMADDIGHEVMEPHGCAYEDVKKLFGEEYVREDGTFDRKKIGDLVFVRPDLLSKLNGIIHPAVHQTIADRARQAEENRKSVCVIEAALLIEADYRDLCREYWYVHTSKEVRIHRLLASRDITPEKIDSIMNAQQSDDTFRTACEFVLENNDDFSKTAAAIDRRIAYLMNQS